jgi:hypothetical protein
MTAAMQHKPSVLVADAGGRVPSADFRCSPFPRLSPPAMTGLDAVTPSVEHFRVRAGAESDQTEDTLNLRWFS